MEEMKVPMGPPPTPMKQNRPSDSTSSPFSSSDEACEASRQKAGEEHPSVVQEEVKVTMGPPPPRSSSPKLDSESTVRSGRMAEPNQLRTKVPMGPPPPRVSNSAPNLSSDLNAITEERKVTDQKKEEKEQAEGKEAMDMPTTSKNSGLSQLAVPYVIPPWSEASGNPFYLEILKDGSIIGQLDV